MGMLYAKVAGQWVPVAPAGTVLAPAYAGYRGDVTTSARFGHVGIANGTIGFLVNSVGSLDAIAANGSIISFWQVNAAGTSHDQMVSHKLNDHLITPWRMGHHPVHGTTYAALYRDGAAGGADYTLMSRTNGSTFINASAAQNIYFQVGNADIFRILPGELYSYKPVTSENNVGASHTQAQLRAVNQLDQVHVSWWCNGYAPQLRAYAGEGTSISCVDSTISAYAPLRASAFPVGSSLAIKRDVRPLRPERERIVVRHDPMVDVQPEPDIMALRPVAFRPKHEPTKLDAEGAPFPEPIDSVFGIEGRRERLGLIADEVQYVIPSAVDHNADGEPLSIDYAQITVALLDHVQRLTDEVATLRYRVAELEGT